MVSPNYSVAFPRCHPYISDGKAHPAPLARKAFFMSASLQIDFLTVTALDSLTAANPTAADLRVRVAFWRRYLATETLAADQAARIAANCRAMEAAADRMDHPAPVVPLAIVPTSVKPIKTVKPAKAAAIGAAEFWDLAGRAVRNLVAARGLSWRNSAPEETLEFTLPARLCAYTGPLGGRIKWRRDHRLPAAKYWPNGALPAGVEAAPSAPRYTGPMGDDHPSLVMIRLARAEQTARDAMIRADATALRPSSPRMLAKGKYDFAG